jgi:Bacteriophage tail sheath protein
MSASPLASVARFPRVAFEARRPVPAAEPLRTDVAGAIVRCPRGPVAAGSTQEREDAPVRLEGWREFQRIFLFEAGDALNVLAGSPLSPWAVKGYFENGGQVLWVVRVARSVRVAAATLPLKDAEGLVGSWPDGGPQVLARVLRASATSPGVWANGLGVHLRLRRGGTPAGRDLADIRVTWRGQVIEHLVALDPLRLVEGVARLSAFIRLSVVDPAKISGKSTRREIQPWDEPWDESLYALRGGADDLPSFVEYERAARALVQEPEPAILFSPDAWSDLDPMDVRRFYRGWASRATTHMDRIVLVDPPCAASGEALHETVESLRMAPADEAADPRYPSAMALYYPRLLVPDTTGSTLRRTRAVPPSGHVAGVISRLDREHGAYYTPANAEVIGAVDLDREYDDAERVVLNEAGLNALRCARGRGVEVWGGRTLHRDSHRRFLAHRRLIHRLVRALRRVAEPLVFDSNTPVLRFALVRAITSVLLEAFFGGALKGSRPEEAFQVVCDHTTNPLDAYDTGHCVAEVSLAPAAPMEFIRIIVSLSQDGGLEVLE